MLAQQLGFLFFGSGSLAISALSIGLPMRKWAQLLVCLYISRTSQSVDSGRATKESA